MQSIINIITELLDKKETGLFEKFLSFAPNNVNWMLLSDYCLEDSTKPNDVLSFSLLMYHDTFQNLSAFIKQYAPKDLKKSGDVSPGFISYLNSPVIYHFSLVIPRKYRLVKSLLTREYMDKILIDTKIRVEATIGTYPDLSEYYIGMLKRINIIEEDMKKKSFNENLFRRMFLAGSFGASIIYFLKRNSSPKYISWMSDRDAIIQKFDGFAFDYMWFSYNMQPMERLLNLETFDLVFQDIPQSGENEFDEIIRIPDYIAGTLASKDFEVDDWDKLHSKHRTIFRNSISNASNHAIIKLECNERKLSAYNVKIV